MTTTDRQEIADKISHSLIKRRYAKCVQRDHIESIYEWNGEIVTSKEYRLMIKCLAEKAHLVAEYVKEVHNYDVPEIIRVNMDGVNEEYAKWMKD